MASLSIARSLTHSSKLWTAGSPALVVMFAEDAYHPRLSPDGKWAAAMVRNGSDYDIWVWPSASWAAIASSMTAGTASYCCDISAQAAMS